MKATVFASDPWASVLEHLQEATSLDREASKWTGSRLTQFLCEATRPDYRWHTSARPEARIGGSDCQLRRGLKVVERTDERDVVISWEDPTRGRLGDQRWRLGTASASGVCAISGKPIKRGDCVFKPMRNTSRFPDLGDMILAAAVDSVYEYKPATNPQRAA
ncbi:DUF3331 domain-containing protein [Paraburkholderia ultramafica]|uniref:DUF3331 domain-containing protein n=1 Tax=Paraburkholderia ultramafica TaxID=1544867 RepID=UPI001581DBC0